MLHAPGQQPGRYRRKKCADQQHKPGPFPVILHTVRQVAPQRVQPDLGGHNEKHKREGADQHTSNEEFGTDRHKHMPLQRKINHVQFQCPVSEFLNQRNDRRAGQKKLNQRMHARYQNSPGNRKHKVEVGETD
ncbi:hypothetical protein D3C75_803490 [compost metagenome]